MWLELICLATSLAFSISVDPSIPQQNVLIFCPRIRLEIEQTRLESTPPESKKAIGLSASNLLSILLYTVFRILLQIISSL